MIQQHALCDIVLHISEWKSSKSDNVECSKVQLDGNERYHRTIEFESPLNAPAIVKKFIGVERALCETRDVMYRDRDGVVHVNSDIKFRQGKSNVAGLKMDMRWRLSRCQAEGCVAQNITQCSIDVDVFVFDSNTWLFRSVVSMIKKTITSQTIESMKLWLRKAEEWLIAHATEFEKGEMIEEERAEESEQSPTESVSDEVDIISIVSTGKSDVTSLSSDAYFDVESVGDQQDEGHGEIENSAAYDHDATTAKEPLSSLLNRSQQLHQINLRLNHMKTQQRKVDLRLQSVEQEVPELSQTVNHLLAILEVKWHDLQQLQQKQFIVTPYSSQIGTKETRRSTASRIFGVVKRVLTWISLFLGYPAITLVVWSLFHRRRKMNHRNAHVHA